MLELAIARALYDRFPDASEGRLAKIRAHVVSRQSCAGVAKELDLARFLLEQAQDVPDAELDRISRSRNVLAALLEAAIAAVYLEHGFEQVEQAVVEAFDARIEFARTGHVDNKTELQEALARSGNQVQYSVIDVEGPPHDRRFVVRRGDRRRAGRDRHGLDEEGRRAGGRPPGAAGDGDRRARLLGFAIAGEPAGTWPTFGHLQGRRDRRRSRSANEELVELATLPPEPQPSAAVVSVARTCICNRSEFAASSRSSTRSS